MDKFKKPSIGKDIIETLTLGMYEDSRFIYREYIQNSADQIDKAYQQNILKKNEGSIFIQIKPEEKYICIEDNATGIKEKEVLNILRNIAQSQKQRGVDKGFRGIGRLGGIGYCDELVFETSYKGESTKSIMTWNSKLLKDIINNRNHKEEANDVIQKVTSIRYEKEKKDEHYFRVCLHNVTNQILLEKDNIYEYLSMVAPVPFSNSFLQKNKIYQELENDNILLDEYNIYINEDKLYKGYTSSVYESNNGKKSIVDKIYDIVFIKEFFYEDLLFWGWYGISNFESQLDRANISRGIRLRKSNIQIGSDETLIKFFKEQRGNYYFVGEIIACHPDLIPNARRDYFLDNDVCKSFEEKLKSIFARELHKIYYDSSKIRSANRKIQSLLDLKTEYKEKVKVGFVNNEEKEKFIQVFESKRNEATKAKKELEKISVEIKGTNNPIKKIFDRVVKTGNINPDSIQINTNNKTKLITDNIKQFSKREKSILSKIFEIIKENISPDQAENLINKIRKEFK